MDYSQDIKKLYTAVLDRHKIQFRVDARNIKTGIRNLAAAYASNPEWKYLNQSTSVDFNDAGHRCAYLFKYAMLHTGVVCEVLEEALRIYEIKQSLCSKQQLNLCSLGSGPGSDILALLLVLEDRFGPKPCNASLIDCSVEWKHVFDLILSELKTIASDPREYFTYEYFGCNLLAFNDDKVYQAIRNADIITMVKFLSAAACKDSNNMIKKICLAMKPGAMLLFVDNAAGGFYEIMESITESCGLKSVLEPNKHYNYEEEAFLIHSYDTSSQYKTKVTIEMWKKVAVLPQNTTRQTREEFFRNEMRAQAYTQSFEEIDGNRITVEKQCYKGPFPETDHSGSRSFRLQPENSEEVGKDSRCCIIM